MLTEIGDRIVAALRKQNPMRTGDLAAAAKLPVQGAKLSRLLVKLADAGRITREGTGRGSTVALPGRGL